MKLTNKQNLPSAFVNSCTSDYKPRDKHYGVTTLLKPTRQILLERRHYDEIEQDVSDMVWLVLGKAVHKVMELADTTNCSEVKLEVEIKNGYFLDGIIDLYNEKTATITDYKTSSVWKVIHQDFDDFKKQGLCYVYMARQKGLYIEHLEFPIILKDWSPSDLKKAKFTNSFYPEHPVYVYRYDVRESDILEIKEFINQKFDDLMIGEKLLDIDLPLCSIVDRWNDGDKYAVFLNEKSKRATKICASEKEAQDYIAEHGGTGRIDVRKGEDKRCLNYCLCCEHCKHYKELQDEN